jgi:hypothetical protein
MRNRVGLRRGGRRQHQQDSRHRGCAAQEEEQSGFAPHGPRRMAWFQAQAPAGDATAARVLPASRLCSHAHKAPPHPATRVGLGGLAPVAVSQQR